MWPSPPIAPRIHHMGELMNWKTMRHMQARQNQEPLDRILGGYEASSLRHPVGHTQEPHGMMARTSAQPILTREMQPRQVCPHRRNLKKDWIYPSNQPLDQDLGDQERD